MLLASVFANLIVGSSLVSASLAGGTSSGLAESSGQAQVSCASSVEVAPERSRLVVRVLDANTQAPIAAAKIFVTGEAGGREFVSDAAGARQIDGVPAGNYVVLADAEVGNDQVLVNALGGHICQVNFRLGELIELEPEPEDIPEEVAIANRRRSEQGGTLKGAGIGVLTLGVALVAGSVMTSLIGPCGDDADGCSDDVRRQLTIGFAVSGGLTIAGGVTMMVVGARRTKVKVAAAPTKGGAAVMLRARF